VQHILSWFRAQILDHLSVDDRLEDLPSDDFQIMLVAGIAHLPAEEQPRFFKSSSRYPPHSMAFWDRAPPYFDGLSLMAAGIISLPITPFPAERSDLSPAPSCPI
jgi:hypothetical protein